MRFYVVTKHKESGLYYIHQEGYSWIPVLGSFTKSFAAAQKQAAQYSGFTTVKEYSEAKRRHKRK